MSRRNDVRVIMLSVVWGSDDVGQSFQIPPDLVVRYQVIDIIWVISH